MPEVEFWLWGWGCFLFHSLKCDVIGLYWSESKAQGAKQRRGRKGLFSTWYIQIFKEIHAI